jgi:hypothetical protein
MSDERAIIIHTAFVQQCVKVGRTVVEELREAIVNNEEITDERLEKLFTPLIDFVEKETDTRVAREADEIRAKLAEKTEQEEKEDMVNEIRDQWDDHFVINVNGKRLGCEEGETAKRLRRTIENSEAQEEFPELKTAVIEDAAPVKNPALLIEDPDLLKEEAGWDGWEEYCPQINVKIDPPGQKLLRFTSPALFKYMVKKNPQLDNIASYTEQLYQHSKTLFGGSYYGQDAVNLAKLCDAALQRPLTPQEALQLLDHRGWLNDAETTVYRFICRHYNLPGKQ